MLVDGLALGLVEIVVVDRRELVEDLLDGELHRGAALLALAPVQHKAL